jgi:FkbM family methyltransferase
MNSFLAYCLEFLILFSLIASIRLPCFQSPYSSFLVYKLILRVISGDLWKVSVPALSLRLCTGSLFCDAIEAVSRKYGTSAWDRFRTFYVSQLAHAVDERSAETIGHILNLSYQWFFFQKTVAPLPPLRLAEEEQAFLAELDKWKAQFPGIPVYYSENFYHHHGLRFIASEGVRRYVSTRDFIDLGASTGDSLVVLKAYTTGRVLSYALIPQTYQDALKWQTPHGLLFNMGVTDRIGVAHVPWSGSPGSNLRDQGSQTVQLTTVDREAERLNLTVGLIKADIERSELPMLLGAMKTLQRDRPVLSLSIYHGEGLLDVSQWISELGGCKIQFFFPAAPWGAFCEASVLAYPE